MSNWNELIFAQRHLSLDRPFTDCRDDYVAEIKQSNWYKRANERSDLHEIIAELADTENADEFDDKLDDLYDEAGQDRIWIG